jgi:hypothetical protein
MVTIANPFANGAPKARVKLPNGQHNPRWPCGIAVKA